MIEGQFFAALEDNHGLRHQRHLRRVISCAIRRTAGSIDVPLLTGFDAKNFGDRISGGLGADDALFSIDKLVQRLSNFHGD